MSRITCRLNSFSSASSDFCPPNAIRSHAGYGGEQARETVRIAVIDGRRVRVHRFSYEMAHNIKLSPDVRALPRIESRLCVNPAHATQQGERGRGHWSTLTINDVREIRRLASTGAARMDIARRFGLSRSAVGNIVNRRRGLGPG
jgi:hypothetical protein